MRIAIFLFIIAFSTTVHAAEKIVCIKDFILSSAVGVQEGYNGSDEYIYATSQFLHEIFNGRPIWKYSQVSEKNGLIVAALRQKNHPDDTQIVVIDRQTKELYKTVKQGNLRFTSFGKCEFSK